jgi:hypothetical protein
MGPALEAERAEREHRLVEVHHPDLRHLHLLEERECDGRGRDSVPQRSRSRACPS